MANKKGLAFFRMDTDKYQDIKIKKLKKEFKRDGVAVYDYILCEIYRVKGCSILWDESTTFDVADYWELKESTVNEIVNYCCAVGLFDRRLLTSERVLTSLSIQLRYIEMCIKAKRKDYKIPDEINLITEELRKTPEVRPITPEVFDREEYSKVEGENYTSKSMGVHPLQNSNLFRNPVIPTIEQVEEIFLRQGGTKEMAGKFFNKHSAVGWFSNGSPITNFNNLVPNFISNWNKNIKESDSVPAHQQQTFEHKNITYD